MAMTRAREGAPTDPASNTTDVHLAFGDATRLGIGPSGCSVERERAALRECLIAHPNKAGAAKARMVLTGVRRGTKISRDNIT